MIITLERFDEINATLYGVSTDLFLKDASETIAIAIDAYWNISAAESPFITN